jgi:hypothetical protein
MKTMGGPSPHSRYRIVPCVRSSSLSSPRSFERDITAPPLRAFDRESSSLGSMVPAGERLGSTESHLEFGVCRDRWA